MKLTRYERETIINYNEEDQTASVYTHSKPLRRKLERLVQERPDECRIEGISHGGQAVSCIIPKAWVKITPKRILTDAEKEQRREAAKKANLSRNKTERPNE